jgi:hypothetical protein
MLVSCGSCFDILTTTKVDQPRLVNGAWWYFTLDKSFGFASNSSIRQEHADKFDCDNKLNCKDSKRLSWGLGWRLGILLFNILI